MIRKFMMILTGGLFCVSSTFAMLEEKNFNERTHSLHASSKADTSRNTHHHEKILSPEVDNPPLRRIDLKRNKLVVYLAEENYDEAQAYCIEKSSTLPAHAATLFWNANVFLSGSSEIFIPQLPFLLQQLLPFLEEDVPPPMSYGDFAQQCRQEADALMGTPFSQKFAYEIQANFDRRKEEEEAKLAVLSITQEMGPFDLKVNPSYVQRNLESVICAGRSLRFLDTLLSLETLSDTLITFFTTHLPEKGFALTEKSSGKKFSFSKAALLTNIPPFFNDNGPQTNAFCELASCTLGCAQALHLKKDTRGFTLIAGVIMKDARPDAPLMEKINRMFVACIHNMRIFFEE